MWNGVFSPNLRKAIASVRVIDADPDLDIVTLGVTFSQPNAPSNNKEYVYEVSYEDVADYGIDPSEYSDSEDLDEFFEQEVL